MLNPESVLVNEKPKLLWDFEIQMDHLISASRPDLIIINKIERTCRIVSFAVPANLLLLLIIIIIIIHSLESFQSVLAGGFSLESERQQVSSSLLDSSQYSGRSQ